MEKNLDLKGLTFGYVEVLSFDEKSRGSGNKRWICKCVCGKEWSVLGYNLKNGNTSSCGCKNIERLCEKYKTSLLGKVFDIYKVISFYGTDESNNTIWNVECIKCGRNKRYLGIVLTDGKTKRCPYTPRNNKPIYKDISGKVFGKLHVVSYFGNDKKQNALWNVVCECGTEKVVAGYELRRGLMSCGCLTESLVANELKKYFKEKYNAEVEYKILKNPETGCWLPYDIYVPTGKNKDISGIYIEIHGEQHYRFVSSWHKTKENFNYKKKLDKIKKKFAKNNGTYIEISLLKIKTSKEAIEYIEKGVNLSEI